MRKLATVLLLVLALSVMVAATAGAGFSEPGPTINMMSTKTVR
jgi:hypothetical protein